MAEDYSELIQFLGKKFERMDEQFERIDGQFEEIKKNYATKSDLKKQADDYIHQNKIIAEALRHQMELLLEGFHSHEEKNERDMAEIKGSMARLERESLDILADLSDHEKRITSLERKA